MNTRRVDVGKGVKRQGRLMRDDTTAQSPGDGRGEIVVFTAGQDWHPVHAATGTLKTTAGRQQAKLHRVDADVPRVTSRDVTMLLCGNLDELIPDSHVRNRIK
jgi:hypothetical protein